MKDLIVSRKTMARLCAEPSPDDGLGPHSRSPMIGGRHTPRRALESPNRKALQLCHQVAETLDEVLAECGDGVLQALRVLDVEPAPDASRLLVTVAVDAPPDETLDPRSVHDHLAKASGHLRSEVAGAITRKRAPVLVYRLAAPEAFAG